MRTATRPRAEEAVRTPVGQRRILLAVGLLIAGFLVFFPARQVIDQRTQIGRLESRLTALQTENERLATEAERLQDPEELELLARERLGMVRPGEQVYLFVPGTEPSPSPAAEEADPGPGIIGRWWAGLVRLVRGGGDEPPA